MMKPKARRFGWFLSAIGGSAVVLIFVYALVRNYMVGQVEKRVRDAMLECLAFQQSRQRLAHLNRVLAAIRNVNQLIIHEKDRARLLTGVCRLLIETRGFDNAWIALVEEARPIEPFFHAGFDGSFTPMIEQLRAGDLPPCALLALKSGGIHVMSDSSSSCADCPLAAGCGDQAGMTMRLEHENRRGEKYEDSKFRHEDTSVHKVGECLCGLVVSEESAMYSKNIDDDSRCTWDECKRAGLISFAALPLCNRNELLG